MPVIRIAGFGGIIPRLGDRLLPDNAARTALNAKLMSGELRSWYRGELLHDFESTDIVSAHRVKTRANDRFLGFTVETEVVKAPLINDAFDRVYWSNEFGVFVSRLGEPDVLGEAEKLGVPPPTVAFTVSPSGGTPATAETRSYVFVLASRYGEEGPSTAPVVASGNADGTWTVNGVNTLSYDTTYTTVEKLRLYRTLTSASGVDYRRVAEWDVSSLPASYNDTVPATTLASSPALQSLAWTPPPEGLRGLVSVAGGFLAGFVGRTLFLSEPYRPHAWPEDYQLAVEDDIVALGAVGNTIVIATTGKPATASGTTPAVMSLYTYPNSVPCLSARGLVSTVSEVLYPSTDGVVSISDAGMVMLSRELITKDEWMQEFSPGTLKAAVAQNRYIGFYSRQLGINIGFADAQAAFTQLQYPELDDIRVDPTTGQAMVLSLGRVFAWDADRTGTLDYVWRSKPFLHNKPVNYGALQLRGTFRAGVPNPTPGDPEGGDTSDVVNATPTNSQPINGYGIGSSLGVPPDAVRVRVFGDGQLRWEGLIANERLVRLPSGFRCELWEVELVGAVPLLSVVMAGTAQELETVP